MSLNNPHNTQSIPTPDDLHQLKMQAKDLLRSLHYHRQLDRLMVLPEKDRRPPWKLHQTQHIIALECGFKSWRKLKEFCEQAASVRFQPSLTEIRSSEPSDETIYRVRQHMAAIGYVVIEQFFDRDKTQEIRTLCEKVLTQKNKKTSAIPYELLFRHPFKSIIRDRYIHALLQAILKSNDLRLKKMSIGIRSLRPANRVTQRVHRDTSQKDHQPLIAYDVMLTQFTYKNGATEIWPGTHITHEAPDQIRIERERISKTPCHQLKGPEGSVILRNAHLWHRAGTNRSQHDRYLLSLGSWYKAKVT